MVLAGRHREGSREQDHLGPAQGENSEDLREAEVVAGREAERDAVQLEGDDLVARRDRGRFLVRRDAVERDVEHVDLAVGGDDLAVGIKDDRRVPHPLIALDQLRKGAGVEVDAVTAGPLREPHRQLARDRLGVLPVAIGIAHVGPDFGQDDQPRAAAGRLIDQRQRLVDIGDLVIARVELDRGNRNVLWSVDRESMPAPPRPSSFSSAAILP